MTKITAWLRRTWPILLLSVALGVFMTQGRVGTGTKVFVMVLGIVAATLWKVARSLRVHATVNRLAALGRPADMLTIVDAELAGARSAQVLVPFTIYKATAMFLQGRWAAALELLDTVDVGQVRGTAGRTWRFLHAAQRLGCLAFLERTDEARQVLTDEVEPFAVLVPSPATVVIVDEARAKIAFFDGRLPESEERFQKLLDDERIMPASRALYHYFLGRIALSRGDDASEHFARATELAPETFVPGAIEKAIEKAIEEVGKSAEEVG